jgi:hypothetical protein
MDDIVKYLLIQLSPFEFLHVAKWTREIALDNLYKMGNSEALYKQWFLGVIKILYHNNRKEDIAKFTSLFSVHARGSSFTLGYSLSRISHDKIYSLWEFSDYFDHDLYGAIVCWMYT